MSRVVPWAWALLLLLTACGPTLPGPRQGPPSAQPPLSPGPIRGPGALEYEFQWRQQVTVTYPEGRASFEAVLQHNKGALTLVGLSAMGLPGFVITVDARGEVTLDNRSGRELPFEPEYIVADVQRVFFPWLPRPEPRQEGRRNGEVLGMSVTESFKAGALQRREFRRADAPGRGAVVVTYGDLQSGQDAPRDVRVDNRWFGYQLQIQTLSQSRL